MSGIGLGAARVAYLGLTGVAFLVVVALADPAVVGRYAVASAYASLGVVALNFGVDRLVLVELAASPQSGVARPLRRARFIPILSIVAATLVVGFWDASYLGAVATVATRLAMGDLESVAIARSQTTPVVAGTLVNGVVTGVAMVGLVGYGHGAMLWSSALGNAAAVAVLLQSASTIQARLDPIPLRWKSIWPFGVMGLVGVIYLRSGIALLAPMGVSVEEIASYSVAFKALEILVTLRGGVVQRDAASVAREGLTEKWVHGATRRWLVLGCALAALILSATGVIVGFGVLANYPHLWAMAAVVGVMAPLAICHGLTSTVIFSREGSTRTLVDSVVLSALSLAAVAVAASTWGVVAVMVVTCAMEFVSYCYFGVRFRRSLVLANVIRLAGYAALATTTGSLVWLAVS